MVGALGLCTDQAYLFFVVVVVFFILFFFLLFVFVFVLFVSFKFSSFQKFQLSHSAFADPWTVHSNPVFLTVRNTNKVGSTTLVK